jgi:hypothetical protein
VRRLAGGGSNDGRSSTELLVDPRKTMTKRYPGQVLAGQLVGCGDWAGQTSKFPFFSVYFFSIFLFCSFCFLIQVSIYFFCRFWTEVSSKCIHVFSSIIWCIKIYFIGNST